MAAALTLQGGCHCGRLRLAFTTALDPANIQPRACDCSFCQKHGAAYVSDPSGELSIIATEPDAIRRYRQGSGTAEFLFCSHCGILVAATVDHDGRLHGAANARCIDAAVVFGEAVITSPKSLPAGQKVDRWIRLWIPDVTVVMDGTSEPMQRRAPDFQ